MKIRVLLFGPLAEKAGGPAAVSAFDLSEDSTAADALSAVSRLCPGLGPALETAVVAVNAVYARRDRRLRDGDEVAVIPPVSGG